MRDPDFYPYDEENNNRVVSASFDVANNFRKLGSTVYKYSNTIASLIQAVTALAVADIVVAVDKEIKAEVQKTKEAKERPEPSGEQEQAETGSEDVPESGETLEDVAESLTDEEKEQAEELQAKVKSGSLSFEEATKQALAINSEATLRALNAVDAEGLLELTAADGLPSNSVISPAEAQEAPVQAVLVPLATIPEPLPPVLSFSSTFDGANFIVSVIATDPEGEPVTITIDGVETDTISFTVEELAFGNLPDVVLSATDSQGLTVTEFVSPPVLTNGDGNSAPIALAQSFNIDENQSLTTTVQAFDSEDGLIEITTNHGEFDFDTFGGLFEFTETFTDSEGLTTTETYQATINNVPDLKVDQPLQFTDSFQLDVLPFSTGFQTLFEFDVDPGFDWQFRIDLASNDLLIRISDQDGNVLFDRIADGGGIGIVNLFFFDGDTNPKVDSITIDYVAAFGDAVYVANFFEEPMVFI